MDLAGAINRLTARWAAEHTAGSTVFSGAGAWPLLAFLAEAADGAARAELEDAIGVPAARGAEAGRAALELMASIPAVRAALGLWTRPGLPVRDAWLATLPSGAHGTLTGQAALDAWADEHTGGLIPRMPIDLDDDVLLVLATALAVRTTWDVPFDERGGSLTSGPWAPARPKLITRMTREPADVRRADTPGGPLTLIRVAGDGDLDVHLVIGAEDRSPGSVLADGIAALSGPQTPAPGFTESPGVSITKARSSQRHDRVSLTLPPFEVRATHDLLGIPGTMGLGAASDPSHGHFSAISADVPLYIAQAQQSALARFQTKGFEAAAVTAVAASRAMAVRPAHRVHHVEAVLSHPFATLAVHRPTGLVLTATWLAEPSG